MKPGRTIAIVVLALTALTAVAHAEQPKLEQPVLITSAGQSVDVKLAGVLATRQKIEHEIIADATASDLDKFKTLIVVPGYSSKGLGSAGVSRSDEMKRVEEILAAAAEAGIPVMTLHLGGKARRGVQSDDFCRLAVENSTLAIVVAQGDEDGFFSGICEEKEIPLEVVKAMAGAMEPLGKVFAK